jgi:thiol-disulfide isomerase/thioredoxin
MRNYLRNLIIVAGILTAAMIVAKTPDVNFESDLNEGIEFQKVNWDEAISLAKKNDKLIFVDIYAPWCGPCKKMKIKKLKKDLN